MDIRRFFSGDPIILEGFLYKRGESRLTIQLHPGLMLDLDENSCKLVEEATDPVSGKTYIRLTLSPDADINATFQPRLARLALKSGALGVPFTMGGLPQGAKRGPIYAVPRRRDIVEEEPVVPVGDGEGGGDGGGDGDGGSAGTGWYNYQTETLGETDTVCNMLFWGYVTDDKQVGDWNTDTGN